MGGPVGGGRVLGTRKHQRNLLSRVEKTLFAGQKGEKAIHRGEAGLFYSGGSKSHFWEWQKKNEKKIKQTDALGRGVYTPLLGLHLMGEKWLGTKNAWVSTKRLLN